MRRLGGGQAAPGRAGQRRSSVSSGRSRRAVRGVGEPAGRRTARRSASRVTARRRPRARDAGAASTRPRRRRGSSAESSGTELVADDQPADPRARELRRRGSARRPRRPVTDQDDEGGPAASTASRAAAVDVHDSRGTGIGVERARGSERPIASTTRACRSTTATRVRRRERRRRVPRVGHGVIGPVRCRTCQADSTHARPLVAGEDPSRAIRATVHRHARSQDDSSGLRH